MDDVPSIATRPFLELTDKPPMGERYRYTRWSDGSEELFLMHTIAQGVSVTSVLCTLVLPAMSAFCPVCSAFTFLCSFSCFGHLPL